MHRTKILTSRFCRLRAGKNAENHPEIILKNGVCTAAFLLFYGVRQKGGINNAKNATTCEGRDGFLPERTRPDHLQ